MEESTRMLQATCTIPARPDSCAHPRAASSWCCLESSSLEIHSLPTVAVGSLKLSSTPCLKVKTPTHTEYSLPPGLFISTGVCVCGGGAKHHSQVKRVHWFKEKPDAKEMGGRLARTDGLCSKINALNLLKEIREDNSNTKLEQDIVLNEPSGRVRHEEGKCLD